MFISGIAQVYVKQCWCHVIDYLDRCPSKFGTYGQVHFVICDEYVSISVGAEI